MIVTAITTAWSWLAGSKVGRMVAMIGAALLALWFMLARAKRQGAAEERADAIERDRTHADEIRDRVDAVRTPDSLSDVDDRIFRN